MKDFCCPRCGRWVDTAWPSGHSVVTLRLERFFLERRPDTSTTYGPAGLAEATHCLACADALWNRIRALLAETGAGHVPQGGEK